MASLGSMLLYWYHWSHNGRAIDVECDEDSIGGHFLHLLHGRPPLVEWVRAMHISLNLYAEHEFNASTFAARVVAGTGSDMYSAICGGIGALRGPKARRRQRGGVRGAEPLRLRRRSRGGHPSSPGRKRGHHRLRPPGLPPIADPAQPGDQGRGEAPVGDGRRKSAASTSPSASSR